MAKMAQCEHCRATARLGFLDLLPAGWFKLDERPTPAGEVLAVDGATFCGLACLGRWADAEQRRRTDGADGGEAGQVEPAGPGHRLVLARAAERARGGEAGHVAAAQADCSDEGGGYVGPGDDFEDDRRGAAYFHEDR